MITYDREVIKHHAQSLYDSANTIIISHTIAGVILGGGIGYFGGIVGIIAGAAIAGLLGYFRGKQKAFSLQLEAQLALCQVQIEENTRSINIHSTDTSSNLNNEAILNNSNHYGDDYKIIKEGIGNAVCSSCNKSSKMKGMYQYKTTYQYYHKECLEKMISINK